MSANDSHNLALPLRNAAAIFLAHFHVRRGNELIWQKGDADFSGVEWKVLPSGSHAVEKDIIYFEAPKGSNGNPRVGLAAFKNTKLAQNIRRGADVEDEDNDDDDQRGARMLAIGIVVECNQISTPRSTLAATLPHISRLEGLVDALSVDPSCRNLLEEWFEEHKANHTGHFHKAQVDDSKMIFAYDPLLQLPAITNALGPLLPSLLKRLLLPNFRLLLYVPGGTPTFQAAGIAFALGELAYAACLSKEHSGEVCPASDATNKHHGLDIIGLIGLFDIVRRQDEAHRSDTGNGKAWIAWTTDKILLEKCNIYDAVLDLSPMTLIDGLPADDFLATPSALPRLMSTQWSVSKTGKRTASLRKQNWTAREFAIFRGIDEQASRHAALRKGKEKPLSDDERRQSEFSDHQLSTPSSPYLSPTSHLRRQGGASTFIAFLRFWLANFWIVPYHWRFDLRESYGYVPLSIRSDGGIRASIMLLPDDDGEGSEQDSLQEEQLDDPSLSPHLPLPSASSPQRVRRRYSGIDEQGISDEEDDPILAACGATQNSLRRRNSRSRSSVSKSAIESVAGPITSQMRGQDERVTSSSFAVVSKSTLEDDEGGDLDSVEQEANESIKLSLCIYKYWSLWVKELVQGVQGLVREEILATREEDEDQEEVKITAEKLAELQLSANNSVDIELIAYLSCTITDRPVQVQKTWWSIAASFVY